MNTAVQKERIFTTPYLVLMVAELCLKLCTFMQNSILAVYVIEKSGSATIGGLMTTVYMLTSVLCRPASGNAADKHGRFAVIIFGSAIYCCFTGMLFLAIPAALLLIMRIFQGVGFCFGGTGIYALASDIIPESRMSEGIGYLGLAQTLATAMGPALAVQMKNSCGYQTCFAVIFIASLVTLISVVILRGFAIKNGWAVKKQKAEKTETEKVQSQGKKSFLSNLIEMNTMRIAIFAFVVMFCGVTVTTFLITYASQAGVSNSGIFFTVNAIMVAAARVIEGKVHQKYGSTAVIIPGFACLIIAMVGISLHVSMGTIIFCALFYGFGMGFVQPAINAMGVLMADKDKRGLANSTVFLMMDLGGAVSGFVFGMVSDIYGFPVIYMTSAVLLVLFAGLFLIMKKKQLVM